MESFGRPPLERHKLLRSSNLAETERVMGRLVQRHRLSPMTKRQPFSVRLNYGRIGEIGLVHLQYGCDVAVEADQIDDCYYVCMPLEGVVSVSAGGDDAEIGSEAAHIWSPHMRLVSRLPAASRHLGIRIPRQSVNSYLADYLGHAVGADPIFERILNVTRGAGRSWAHVIGTVLRELDDSERPFLERGARPHLEELVIATLLTAQRHTLSENLIRSPASAGTIFVSRVAEYICAEAAAEITVHDLVAVSGVSARSLFRGFRAARGVSPMAFLKQIRLERVREELSQGVDGDGGVTETALKWGFNHLGNFSRDYALRFGELPSQTLRRSRN